MWHGSADRRGTTLPELLVYSLLFLFVLGFIYGSLAMGLEAYRQNENFATVQQQAMTALRSMTDELASSPKAMVVPASGSVVLLSARDARGRVLYDAGGLPIWQAWVAWHVDPGRGLIRTEKAFTPTAKLPSAVPTAASLAADGSASHRVAAPLVDTLEFTSGSSMQIRLVAASDQRGRTAVELQDRVWFRK